MRHRLAMMSLWILAVLYATAIFAGFGPYGKEMQNTKMGYAPLQIPAWNFTHGWHAPQLDQHIDPMTKAVHYRASEDKVIPLSFFVSGDDYRFLGLIPASRHLFGSTKRSTRNSIPRPARHRPGTCSAATVSAVTSSAA